MKECPIVQLNGTIACYMTDKTLIFCTDGIMSFGPNKAMSVLDVPKSYCIGQKSVPFSVSADRTPVVMK